MKLIDPEHPFYAPYWRRVVILAILLGWSVLEFATGAAFLGMILAALAIYCLKVLFLEFDPGDGEEP